MEGLAGLEIALGFGLPLLLIVLGYFVGNRIEAAHFVQIRAREAALVGMPRATFVPDSWAIADSDLVVGNVVVSLDYFKRFLAGLRGIVGGRVKSYESLLDRARREALLRMAEQAATAGFDAVMNVRVETSRLASSRADGKGTAGVEIFAYGTAVRRQASAA